MNTQYKHDRHIRKDGHWAGCGISNTRANSDCHQRLKLIYITYKDSVPASLRTHCASVRKANRQMMFKKIITVSKGNHITHINKLCGQNAEF